MNESQKDLTTPPDSHAILANEDCIEWYKSTHPDRISGVALVIHGLNLRPDKMGSIIALLTHSYIDVLSLSLRGHGKNYAQQGNFDSKKARLETFKRVSYKLWIKETYRAYAFAWKRSQEKQVPLFLIGFSMGGLIGTTLFASYPDVYFSRMVLLAPAIGLHKIFCLAKFLFPFPKLVIPSLLMGSYGSNKGTPMAAYHALFECIEHFNKNITQKLNVPTIIFIDKRDELVSHRRIERIVKNKGLCHWKMYPVKKQTKDAKEKMRHLIIDEPSIGENAWNEMGGNIIHHLIP